MLFLLFFSISTLSLFLLLFPPSFPPCFSRLMFFSLFVLLSSSSRHFLLLYLSLFLLPLFFLCLTPLFSFIFLPCFPSSFFHLIRFIELMPFDGNEWSREKFVGYLEVLQTLQSNGINLVRESSEKEDPHGK